MDVTTIQAISGIKDITQIVLEIIKLLLEERNKKAQQYDGKEVFGTKKQINEAGEKKLNTMQKTGETLKFSKCTMTSEQKEQLCIHAEQREMPIAFIQNGEDKNAWIAIYFEKDTERFKDITEQVMRDEKLRTLDETMKTVGQSRGESEKDNNFYEELINEREKIIKEDVKQFNSRQTVSFDDAIEHYRTNGLSGDKSYYMCQKDSMDSYIVIASEKRVVSTEEHFVHTYAVYQEGSTASNTTNVDKQWTDENSNNYTAWNATKTSMKEVSGFSDNVAVFVSKEEMCQYVKCYEVDKTKPAQSVEAKDRTLAIEQKPAEMNVCQPMSETAPKTMSMESLKNQLAKNTGSEKPEFNASKVKETVSREK